MLAVWQLSCGRQLETRRKYNMARSPNGPIRRAQAIAPFGVGAMVTMPGGTSLIMGGLDYWFQSSQESNSEINLEEFKFQEWRLQGLIGRRPFPVPARLPGDLAKRRRDPQCQYHFTRTPFSYLALLSFLPPPRTKNTLRGGHRRADSLSRVPG